MQNICLSNEMQYWGDGFVKAGSGGGWESIYFFDPP